MFSELEFVNLVNDFMAMDVTPSDMDEPLVNLGGWDSLNAVRLMTQLERELDCRIPIARYIESTTLRQIYALLPVGASA